MPASIEKSKLYTFQCQLVGDYVKIVTGRADGKLSIAELKVFADGNEMNVWKINSLTSTSFISNEYVYTVKKCDI